LVWIVEGIVGFEPRPNSRLCIYAFPPATLCVAMRTELRSGAGSYSILL